MPARRWSLIDGLWNHPHRPQWQPGGGGLCLHTILARPGRAATACASRSRPRGTYRTDDGGATWRPRNRGVRAEFLPDTHPGVRPVRAQGRAAARRPERLFLQNHWGLYRSDDGGDSWTDIANGVPSDFGFAHRRSHPRDPDTAYIVPLESDEFRCTPEGKLRVYRTRDAGASWQAMTSGLPQKDAFETVLRDALAVDALRSGRRLLRHAQRQAVRLGRRGARPGRTLADGLPPIIAVKAGRRCPDGRRFVLPGALRELAGNATRCAWPARRLAVAAAL